MKLLPCLLALAVLFAASARAEPRADAPPKLSFVFEETVLLGATLTPGATAMGKRFIVPITGGHFEGPGDGSGLRGKVLPGGWDWQLLRADGCLNVKADYMLQTDDGVIVNVVNTGPLCPGRPVLTTPIFEPPLGKYQWLGQSAFVGALEVVKVDGQPAVRIRFYRVDADQ
jgi:hypothetical protein